MAEYSDGSSVSRLIGVGPGYSGSDKPGIIPGWLHTYRNGVLLFDEIEKAHPDVHKLLLGLLDNGRITSGKGETLDAKPCIVILTTNAVAAKDLVPKRKIGIPDIYEIPKARELLEDHFPREFLSRFDSLVLFKTLDGTAIRKIIGLRLNESLERMKERKVHLTYDRDRLVTHLQKGLEENKSGARGVRQLIEKELLQPISYAIVCHSTPGQELKLALEEPYYKFSKVTVLS